MRIFKVKTNKPNDTNGFERLLEEFLLFKTAQNLAEKTVSTDAKILKIFFKRYPLAKKNPKKYALQFLSEDIKPATYNLRLNSLKSFFNYCVQEGHMEESPLCNMKKRKAAPRIVDVDMDVLKKLLSLPDKQSFTGLRDYAMILLALDTGIRPKESSTLREEDINLSSLQLIIKAENAKTRQTRTLPMSKVTAKAIEKFLSYKPSNWRNSWLFCTYEGHKLHEDTFRHRLNYYSKILGVKIRPYDLRHAFALNFLRNEGNVFALQRTMGHSDLSMTKRYLALTHEDLKIQHEKASPVNALVTNRIRKVNK